MNDIIKITNSPEDSGALVDGVSETVKHEIQKIRRRISRSLFSTFSRFRVQPVISSVVKGTSERGVRSAGKGYMNKNF